MSSGFHIPTQNPEPYHYPINQGSVRCRPFLYPRGYDSISVVSSMSWKTLPSTPTTTPLPTTTTRPLPTMTLMLRKDTLILSTFTVLTLITPGVYPPPTTLAEVPPVFDTPSNVFPVFSGVRWHSYGGQWSPPLSIFSNPKKSSASLTTQLARGGTATPVHVWQHSKGVGPEAAHFFLYARSLRGKTV